MRYSADSTGVDDCPTRGLLRDERELRRDESDSDCDESTLSAMILDEADGTILVVRFLKLCCIENAMRLHHSGNQSIKS